MSGKDGRREAALRYGRKLPGNVVATPGVTTSRYAPPGERKDREWTLEALLEHPSLKATAYADHKFHGNRTAMRALGELRAAVAAIEAEHQDD